MGKKVYVDGTIVIESMDFKYQGAGCLCTIPEGAEVIDPNDFKDGHRWLIIDDKRPQSIFKEYYATGGFTQLYKWAYYLNSDYQRAYNNYVEKRDELKDVFTDLKEFKSNSKPTLYKLLLLNVVTLFDAFVCEAIISKVTSSEECFNKYYASMTKKEIKKLIDKSQGEKEQRVIYSIMKQSYADKDEVDKAFKKVYGFNNVTSYSGIKKWLDWRHRIVHRNAREKNGSFHVFTEKDVRDALNDVDKLISKIVNLISNTENKVMV